MTPICFSAPQSACAIGFLTHLDPLGPKSHMPRRTRPPPASLCLSPARTVSWSLVAPPVHTPCSVDFWLHGLTECVEGIPQTVGIPSVEDVQLSSPGTRVGLVKPPLVVRHPWLVLCHLELPSDLCLAPFRCWLCSTCEPRLYPLVSSISVSSSSSVLRAENLLAVVTGCRCEPSCVPGPHWYCPM